jgi:glycosyltransferase involved in cell wall biosynthesis
VDVEIVIPVHNERLALEGSVRRLHGFLRSSFPFTWRIMIADNASTDGTLALAHRLSYDLASVEVIHVRAKGRGRALRAAWLASDARVLCCVDVDLPADLAGMLPLIAPLLSGHKDIAISDAQSGFKAIRARSFLHRPSAALRLVSPQHPMLAP